MGDQSVNSATCLLQHEACLHSNPRDCARTVDHDLLTIVTYEETQLRVPLVDVTDELIHRSMGHSHTMQLHRARVVAGRTRAQKTCRGATPIGRHRLVISKKLLQRLQQTGDDRFTARFLPRAQRLLVEDGFIGVFDEIVPNNLRDIPVESRSTRALTGNLHRLRHISELLRLLDFDFCENYAVDLRHLGI
jgi:hypothetical protein